MSIFTQENRGFETISSFESVSSPDAESVLDYSGAPVSRRTGDSTLFGFNDHIENCVIFGNRSLVSEYLTDRVIKRNKNKFTLFEAFRFLDRDDDADALFGLPPNNGFTSNIEGLVGIVIVAHGGLSKEYLAALEHVAGPQPGIVCVSINPDDDRREKQVEVCKAADMVDAGAGVVIVTDLFGGRPSNVSLQAAKGNKDRRIVYGANLPLLIKIAKSRHRPVSEAVKNAVEAGRKYVNSLIIDS